MPRRSVAVEEMYSMETLAWEWKSPTSGARSITEFINLLRQHSFSLTPPGCTPASDARTPLLGAVTYLAVIVLFRACKLSSFARSRGFLVIAVAHNIAVSVMSLIMHIGINLAIWRIASSDAGVAGTFCVPIGDEGQDPLAKFWVYIFYLTKYWEYLDTLLLVFRGRPLSLLHVWHHASVPVEVYAWLHFKMVLGIYGMWFNTLVHTFMYAYFAARLLKIPVPWKRVLTSIQILQFLVGFAFAIPWLWLHWTSDRGCEGGGALGLAATFNASYLILFLLFYRRTYKNRDFVPSAKEE